MEFYLPTFMEFHLLTLIPWAVGAALAGFAIVLIAGAVSRGVIDTDPDIRPAAPCPGEPDEIRAASLRQGAEKTEPDRTDERAPAPEGSPQWFNEK
jgi:hypothetical protein